MLSTLPKLADRAFILGFFLPSLLFVLALLMLYKNGTDATALLKIAGEKDLPSAVLWESWSGCSPFRC